MRRVLFAILDVGCSQDLSPEHEALELVQNSYALGGDLPVVLHIKKRMEDQKDDVREIGWEVTRKDKDTYLISYIFRIYSFSRGVGERGYFFEVDLRSEEVRDVTNEKILMMKPLSANYKDDKDIFDESVKKIEGLKESGLSQ